MKFFRTKIRDPLKSEKIFEGPPLPSVLGIFQALPPPLFILFWTISRLAIIVYWFGYLQLIGPQSLGSVFVVSLCAF